MLKTLATTCNREKSVPVNLYLNVRQALSVVAGDCSTGDSSLVIPAGLDLLLTCTAMNLQYVTQDVLDIIGSRGFSSHMLPCSECFDQFENKSFLEKKKQTQI